MKTPLPSFSQTANRSSKLPADKEKKGSRLATPLGALHPTRPPTGALGVTVHGTKEFLGMWIEKTEGAKFWLKILNELKTRGVEDMLVVCCDGLKGFADAIETGFPQATVQTCIVHMIRNSLRYVSYKDRKAVHEAGASTPW